MSDEIKYAYAQGLAETIVKSAQANVLLSRLHRAASNYLKAVRQMEYIAGLQSRSQDWRKYEGMMSNAHVDRRTAHEDLLNTYKEYVQTHGRLHGTDPLDRYAVGDLASKIKEGG